MALSWIDFAVIFVYFAGLFGLGLALSRRQISRETYFLGNRQVPAWLAGISVVATLISTVSYLAVPGEMIRYGLGLFTSQLAFFLVIPILVRYIIPALMNLRVTSVYEYLEQRFGSRTRTLGAVVFMATRLIWIGLIFYTAAFAVSAMTGWSIPLLILVMGIVTTAYTAMGGLEAVIWSDFAQFVILVGGAIFIPIYVGLETGTGPLEWWRIFSEAGRARVPVFSLDPTVRVTIVGSILSTFVWTICTHGADQVAAQRYLSTASARAAGRTVWVYSLGSVGMVGLLMFAGVALFYLNFGASGLPLQAFQSAIAAEADKVLPRFIGAGLPAGMSGLLLAALLAAAMSSLSSGINSISAVATTDFVQRFALVPARKEGVGLAVALAVLTGVIGMGVGLAVTAFMQRGDWNLVELMERLNHLFVAPLGALFFVGLISKRATPRAAVTGFAAGLLTSVLIAFSRALFGLQTGISFMWIMPASLAVSMAVALGMGRWSARADEFK